MLRRTLILLNLYIQYCTIFVPGPSPLEPARSTTKARSGWHGTRFQHRVNHWRILDRMFNIHPYIVPTSLLAAHRIQQLEDLSSPQGNRTSKSSSLALNVDSTEQTCPSLPLCQLLITGVCSESHHRLTPTVLLFRSVSLSDYSSPWPLMSSNTPPTQAPQPSQGIHALSLTLTQPIFKTRNSKHHVSVIASGAKTTLSRQIRSYSSYQIPPSPSGFLRLW